MRRTLGFQTAYTSLCKLLNSFEFHSIERAGGSAIYFKFVTACYSSCTDEGAAGRELLFPSTWNLCTLPSFSLLSAAASVCRAAYTTFSFLPWAPQFFRAAAVRGIAADCKVRAAEAPEAFKLHCIL